MIDHEKIEQAVRLLLEGMGEDVNREGLIDTPDRIARMYEEIYGGMDEDAGKHLSKTFTVDSHEMVIEKDITFYSTCEHHLLPFYGKAHIAYIPDGKVVGLSKLARTVEVFARRLQLQEQLTGQMLLLQLFLKSKIKNARFKTIWMPCRIYLLHNIIICNTYTETFLVKENFTDFYTNI